MFTSKVETTRLSAVSSTNPYINDVVATNTKAPLTLRSSASTGIPSGTPMTIKGTYWKQIRNEA